MAIKPTPNFDAVSKKWSIVIIEDDKQKPILGVEPKDINSARKFIEEEATLIREYAEAHSNLTIVGFYLYSNGITNSEAGATFTDEWDREGVRVW